MPKNRRLTRARLRSQPAGGGIYHFALTRARRDEKGELVHPAGVMIQQKHHAKAKARLVTLDELVADRGMRVTVAGVQWVAVIGEDGVKMRPAGRRRWKLVPWAELADKALASDDTPEQFALIPGTQTENRFTKAKKL